MTATTGWVVVLLSGVGCTALKLLGYLLPQRWFAHPRLRKAVELMPVALLAALIVVEALAAGRHYDADGARLAGFGVGAVAVWRRLPFIVIIAAAGATAAVLRLL